MKNTIDPKTGKHQQQENINDPQEVINAPEEVQESNDESIDQDFTGYPHEPSTEESITNNNSFSSAYMGVEDFTRESIY